MSQQPLQNHMRSSSSSQAHIQSVHAQQNAGDLLRKLQESTIAALRTSSNAMDSNNSSGGSSKGTPPGDKGKGYDQSVMFSGLIPRIETRGHSNGPYVKSSSKKKDGKTKSHPRPLEENSLWSVSKGSGKRAQVSRHQSIGLLGTRPEPIRYLDVGVSEDDHALKSRYVGADSEGESRSKRTMVR